MSRRIEIMLWAFFAGFYISLNRSKTLNTVIFCDSKYKTIFFNWAEFARENIPGRVFLIRMGDFETSNIRFYNLTVINAPTFKNLRDLWFIRCTLFFWLSWFNIEFIHTDADAIPINEFYTKTKKSKSDIDFSIGGNWPVQAHKEWGFVLCCGFFINRSNRKATKFWRRVLRRIKSDKDDQIAVNMILLERGVNWQTPVMLCEETTILAFSTCIDELTIGILDDVKFVRSSSFNDDAYVVHPITAKSSAQKEMELRKLGLWRLD